MKTFGIAVIFLTLAVIFNWQRNSVQGKSIGWSKPNLLIRLTDTGERSLYFHGKLVLPKSSDRARGYIPADIAVVEADSEMRFAIFVRSIQELYQNAPVSLLHQFHFRSFHGENLGTFNASVDSPLCHRTRLRVRVGGDFTAFIGDRHAPEETAVLTYEAEVTLRDLLRAIRDYEQGRPRQWTVTVHEVQP
jgi:hypothetical protein